MSVDESSDECTYCGSDVTRHDPVYVAEDAADGGRVDVGQFCNYACLVQYVEEEGLTEGACCTVDLG
ncbi:hypothetical protein [Halospeciosus flavus]|uniref:MYM-type domain-containing protein n=1 Tax=Halospeciosus flavus TaxID=3032283 RepID=A0ABD5Z7S3_9EURY|nr:hypothetical protein [Halospeciosus flavus]